MPRSSLTDTGDFSSAERTHISPLAAQCVWTQWVCARVKDMHGILPYPLPPRSRCLVYAAARHRQAISDTYLRTHSCNRWVHTYAVSDSLPQRPFSCRIWKAKASSPRVACGMCISHVTLVLWFTAFPSFSHFIYFVFVVCFFCPTGACETHPRWHWEDEFTDRLRCNEGMFSFHMLLSLGALKVQNRAIHPKRTKTNPENEREIRVLKR